MDEITSFGYPIRVGTRVAGYTDSKRCINGEILGEVTEILGPTTYKVRWCDGLVECLSVYDRVSVSL